MELRIIWDGERWEAQIDPDDKMTLDQIRQLMALDLIEGF